MKLEITRRAELAVRALSLLSRTGARMNAVALADTLGTEGAFVPQVMGPLLKAGWVQECPAPLAGYLSIVDVQWVMLLDVIQAVDGAAPALLLVEGDHDCDVESPCLLHTVWEAARMDLLKVLSSTSVSAMDPVRRPTAPT